MSLAKFQQEHPTYSVVYYCRNCGGRPTFVFPRGAQAPAHMDNVKCEFCDVGEIKFPDGSASAALIKTV